MYKEPFYLEGNVGNNAFSFEERGENPKLFVPTLIEGNLDDVKEGSEITFEEYDEGTLYSFPGLQNFVYMKHPDTGAPVYIFDNHNHAFYFWLLEYHNRNFQKKSLLVHVDQHSDMREPQHYISEADSSDLEKVFHYTNYVLNVGNFIKPALKLGLFNEVRFLGTETAFSELSLEDENMVLDIDIDLFAEGMSHMDVDYLLQETKHLMKKAKMITIATSPYFIGQKRGIEFVKKLFE